MQTLEQVTYLEIVLERNGFPLNIVGDILLNKMEREDEVFKRLVKQLRENVDIIQCQVYSNTKKLL